LKDSDICVNCGAKLVLKGSVKICLKCNSPDIEDARVFLDQEDSDYVFIECPGATLYEPGTNNVAKGVRWHDEEDPSKGYETVGEQIYSPTHTRFRRIKKDAVGNIRRCQGCQDYTIRMRRKEGPDFFIPSHRHPGRKKLKTVEYTTRP
jgi:hypothetical protein